MVLEGDAPEPALDRADVILQVLGKVERLGATSWSVVEWRRRGGGRRSLDFYPILSYPIPAYPFLSHPIPSHPILARGTGPEQ